MRTLKFCSLSKLQLYNTVLPTIVTMLCMSSSDLSYNGKFVAVHQPLPISPTPQALAIPVLLSAFTPLLYFLDSTVCLQPLWGLPWCSCAPPPKWKMGRDQRKSQAFPKWWVAGLRSYNLRRWRLQRQKQDLHTCLPKFKVYII